MFVLKVHNEELNKIRTRKTRVNDLNEIKEIIEKLYNNFLEKHPHYRMTIEVKGVDDEKPIFICIKDLNSSNEYILIEVYKLSKKEVNNEYFISKNRAFFG